MGCGPCSPDARSRNSRIPPVPSLPGITLPGSTAAPQMSCHHCPTGTGSSVPLAHCGQEKMRGQTSPDIRPLLLPRCAQRWPLLQYQHVFGRSHSECMRDKAETMPTFQDMGSVKIPLHGGLRIDSRIPENRPERSLFAPCAPQEMSTQPY